MAVYRERATGKVYHACQIVDGSWILFADGEFTQVPGKGFWDKFTSVVFAPGMSVRGKRSGNPYTSGREGIAQAVSADGERVWVRWDNGGYVDVPACSLEPVMQRG